MSDKYNGWTNYATWRVNLEIFDGIDPTEMGWHKLDLYDLADALQEYAIAFMADVNFREIANNIVEGYEDERDFETDYVEA